MSVSVSVFEKLHRVVEEAVRELVLYVLGQYAGLVAEWKREVLTLAVEAKLALLEDKSEEALKKINEIIAMLD